MKTIALLAALVTPFVAGCGSKDTIEQLQDPATCMECHPKHVQQWSGSMHAYASDDPVFLAMNKRGQRETNGALGTFCIQCHAPMAVKLGLTTADNAKDFDPAALPATARGITCYFCHNVASVGDAHNNGLALAMDDTMRGGAQNPVDSPAHSSAYDPTMASATNKSTMCGSCHDVVTPRGVALERTFTEWQGTIFAHEDPVNMLPLTCSKCHMNPSKDVIADKPGLNVPSRDQGFHDHGFPAIDKAVTPFPQLQAQADGIDAILKPAIAIKGAKPLSGAQPGGICLEPNQLTVRMDTFGTGHMFPSGAAQDRRAWLEVKAYDLNGAVVFSSGDVPDGMDPEAIMDPNLDPNLVGFWDRTLKDDGTPAHFFWDVATYTSILLKPPITLVATELGYDHSTTAKFPVIGALRTSIERITARIRILPVAYSVLDQLIASGDLDPSIRAQMKVLDIPSGMAVWTKATQSPVTFCNPFPSPP